MPSALSRVPQYGTTITHPNPGDSASASQLLSGVNQNLADATRLLFLDTMGARIAQLARVTIGSGGNTIIGVIEAFPATNTALLSFGIPPIHTSPTGEDSTWTSRTTLVTPVNAAVKGGTRLVICGGTNGIESSDNGITYTARTLGAGAPSTVTFTDAAYGAGVFVLVGTTATTLEIQSSSDGATWTRRTHPLSGVKISPSVTFRTDRFVVAAYDNGTEVDIMTSVDGSSWSAATSITGATADLAPIVNNGSRLVVANGNKISYSDDYGASWLSTTIAANAGGAFAAYAAGFARGLFVVIGRRVTSGLFEAFVSDDGAQWFDVSTFPGDSTGGPSRVRYSLGRWWSAIQGSTSTGLRSPRSVNI